MVLVVPVSVVSSCLHLAGRVGMWLKMAPIGSNWLLLAVFAISSHSCIRRRTDFVLVVLADMA